jgi:large exoprotein involved in heme utilization and adhesion
LKILNGGRIDSSTLADGAAGTIEINALDSILIGGKGQDALTVSQIGSSALELHPIFSQFLNFPAITGSSGSVKINTNRLTLTEGGQINVRNDGTGDAGTLSIESPEIFVNSGSSLTATTASGNGGEVRIESSDLRLQDGNITATAGGNGNGGNLFIDTDTLAMLGNSNITANAVFGNGGNITIDTQGLFQSPDSAIAASSEFGIDGTVSIDTPGTALITNELNNPTEVPF